MERAQKEQVLGEIKEAWKNVASIVIADYRGITVPVVTAMRDDFRKAGCHYRVIKNSLVKIAVKGSKMEPITAAHVRHHRGDLDDRRVPQPPAKIALKWAKDEPKFKIMGGYYEGSVLDLAGRRDALEDAGQERDPRLDADDVPRGSAGLRRADRGADSELCLPPRCAQAPAREVRVTRIHPNQFSNPIGF